VEEAQVKLEKLDQDLQRLRTRVAAPITPYEPRISLEQHIENLRKGVEVLTEARSEARRKEDQVIESIADRRKYARLESQ
jgi:phage baseplate assembly protein W